MEFLETVKMHQLQTQLKTNLFLGQAHQDNFFEFLKKSTSFKKATYENNKIVIINIQYFF